MKWQVHISKLVQVKYKRSFIKSVGLRNQISYLNSFWGW